MLLRCAPYALLSSAAAFACGSQISFSATQTCPNCPPPVERETYCAASFLSPDNYSAPSENAELVAVQLIGRHGDRAPLVTKSYWDVTWDCTGEQQLSFFTGNASGIKPERAMITRERVSIPEDGPYSSGMWRGSCDVGQLTPRGASAQRQMGAQLRQVYVEKLQFLPEMFEEKAGICVRSTAHSRNKQSASRILSGLYPGEFRPDGSIVEMVTVPKEIEYLERNPKSCPAQSKIIRAVLRSKRFKAHMKQNRWLFKKLHTVFGDPANPQWPKRRTFLSYFEHLAPRVCHQMPIPCDRSLQTCLTNEDVDAAMRHARWELAYIFQNSPYSRQLNKLVTGSFLAELRAKMKRHADSSSSRDTSHHHRKPRFEIYSAQEETLASLLGAFHVRKPTIPPYSSSIIVELWRYRPGSGGPFLRLQSPSSATAGIRYDDFFVRIWYNGQLLDVQWCDMNACPSRVIWENTKELVPRNIEEECTAKKMSSELPDDDDDGDDGDSDNED